MNRELGVSGGLTVVQERKLPREMVKRGPETIRESAEREGNGILHRSRFKCDDMARVLNIVFTSGGNIRFIPKVNTRFPVERLEVVMRTTNLNLRKQQGWELRGHGP